MTKSHVSMEQHQCAVCGITYDTGAILLDKRLRANLERYTVTGSGMCPEHQKLKDDGYVALIEVTEAMKLRTGIILHVRASVWAQIFDVPVPPESIAMIPPEVTAVLKGRQNESS